MSSAPPIDTGPAILAFIGLVLGVVVLVLVIILFNRIVGPALEIRRYAQDIRVGVQAIENNVQGLEELNRTREAAARIPMVGVAYADQLGRR